jgi:phosphatidylserine decarboxylase
MKHAGRAQQAALKLILLTLVGLLAVISLGILATTLVKTIVTVYGAFILLWIIFAGFTFYFFRDPNPRVPAQPNVVLSPAHGKVDIVDEIDEPDFMGGKCQRISIFLSVIDIHVQNAPVGGKLALFKYTKGSFMSALKTESAAHNENLLFGIDSGEKPGMKIAMRLIAGVLARRIVPFIQEGDEFKRGERISLIQFGSRTDLYLPATAKIRVKVGSRVVGGETVMAEFE